MLKERFNALKESLKRKAHKFIERKKEMYRYVASGVYAGFAIGTGMMGCAGTLMPVSVLAGGNTDPNSSGSSGSSSSHGIKDDTGFLTNGLGAVDMAIKAFGGVFAAIGVVQLIIAFKNENPEGYNGAVRNVAIGIALFVAGTLFTTMVTSLVS